jgi:hypothetical protein
MLKITYQPQKHPVSLTLETWTALLMMIAHLKAEMIEDPGTHEEDWLQICDVLEREITEATGIGMEDA